MSLFNKKNRYLKASRDSLEFDEIIKDYQKAIEKTKDSSKIREYQQKIEKIKAANTALEEKMENMESDFTILVCIYANRDDTHYVYYDADIGRTRYSTNNQEKVDVDLHDFFVNYTIPGNRRLLFAYHFPSRIMEEIIDDMTSKKEYQSWDEVKADLLELEKMYKRPTVNEAAANYYERVICQKNKKR